LIRRALSLAAFLAILLSPLPSPARGELELQLQEILRLVDERNYITALEDLQFIARQIQELRLAEILPLFPDPPPGWKSEPPLRTSRNEDLWNRRLQVRRRYLPAEGEGKVEMLFDFYSPLIPEVNLSLNPVLVAADPRAELLDLGGQRARLLFNDDTAEGELVLAIGTRVLVSVAGRGIVSREVLREFAGRIDMDALAAFTLP